MSLSQEQELEMFSDIKVIKNNCVVCRTQISDHEKRIKFLESRFWAGLGGVSAFTFILHYFLK